MGNNWNRTPILRIIPTGAQVPLPPSQTLPQWLTKTRTQPIQRDPSTKLLNKTNSLHFCTLPGFFHFMLSWCLCLYFFGHQKLAELVTAGWSENNVPEEDIETEQTAAMRGKPRQRRPWPQVNPRKTHQSNRVTLNLFCNRHTLLQRPFTQPSGSTTLFARAGRHNDSVEQTTPKKKPVDFGPLFCLL